LRLVAAAGVIAGLPCGPVQAQEASPLEEIIVTATLLPLPLGEVPASVTVLDSALLRAAGVQHFADVMGLVPNLNWSGGTSRPRYFQIRGIGELEQYQGAPNPSVGFLIDDVDYSGVGMPATSFDVEQVEVLRGPQGTTFGANALAGLIKVKTRDPRQESEFGTEVTAGDDGILGAGLVAGGGLDSAHAAAWRLVAQQTSSDGFRRNTYLGRDDTNGRDELTLRGKLHFEPAAEWRIDLAAMRVDIDNGYDAFALDNSLETRSDRPGRDAQVSDGATVGVSGDVGGYGIRSTTAAARSDIVYSFDGDWANDTYWGEYAPYDYFSRYARERRTLSQDLRVDSATSAREHGYAWVAGAFALRLTEDGLQRDEFSGELLRPLLDSQYEATNVAGYGQGEWLVRDQLVLSVGLRVESRAAEYRDSDGAEFSPDDAMVGGHLSVTGGLGEASSWYATASRGYKAGGFNIGALVPEDRREFEPEYLWNLETGVRVATADGTFEASLALFHMWRDSQQVATSFQADAGDPLSYVFYTDNAASGRNYGLEASLSWRLRPSLVLGATLGLLESEYLDYHYGERDLDGREQAHAPGYQYSLSAEWQSPLGWMMRADVFGCDAFYFDASHDQRSEPYTLVNLKAGYVSKRWSAYAWGRNVLDEEFAVRGFYFGLEPPDFSNELYVQRGDPRQMGVTVEWRIR
jgi:outer membrane receptor protein involved in Fe transport